MVDNEELFDLIDSVLGVRKQSVKEQIQEPLPVRQDKALIERYANYFNKPSEKEREEYWIKKEQEDKLREEEYSKRGIPFLSDEWRWARIDAEYERCKKVVEDYEKNDKNTSSDKS